MNYRTYEPQEYRAYLLNMALDFFNNFLTVESFAEHYSISDASARRLIRAYKNIVN